MKRKYPRRSPSKVAKAEASAAQQGATQKVAPRVFNRDQALLDAVTAQRNQALNDVATLSANLAVATAAIHEQDAKIADLERRLSTYETPETKRLAPVPEVAAAH